MPSLPAVKGRAVLVIYQARRRVSTCKGWQRRGRRQTTHKIEHDQPIIVIGHAPRGHHPRPTLEEYLTLDAADIHRHPLRPDPASHSRVSFVQHYLTARREILRQVIRSGQSCDASTKDGHPRGNGQVLGRLLCAIEPAVLHEAHLAELSARFGVYCPPGIANGGSGGVSVASCRSPSWALGIGAGGRAEQPSTPRSTGQARLG